MSRVGPDDKAIIRLALGSVVLHALISATPFEKREEVDRKRMAAIAVEWADDLIAAATPPAG